MADEANHRDVNHTFAGMKNDDPNPFIQKHKEDAYKAWRMEEAAAGAKAWKAENTNIKLSSSDAISSVDSSSVVDKK